MVVSNFRSLRGDIDFRSLFEAPVSGGKNPVPNSIGQAGRKSALTPALPAFERGQAIVFRPLLARQSPAAKIPFQMQDASRERGYVTLT